MLFSVGFPVWETTSINPHGWAFPLSSHRMLRGRYRQQDAETPCPRHGAWSSCKRSALFYPPDMLIQQGALQLWGFFVHIAPSQSPEGWSWDHITHAALSQSVEMFLTGNSEASFTSPKGWGERSAATHLRTPQMWAFCCHTFFFTFFKSTQRHH